VEKTIGDVFFESREYLNSLSTSFVPAISRLNQRERSFQILDGLSIGDIYTDADFNSENLKEINLVEFEKFLAKLNTALDSSNSIHEFIELTQAECFSWSCPEFEYDDELNIVGEVDNPTYKLFSKFGDLYLQRIDELVDEIIRNNFEEHWTLLFELKSFSEIESFLGASEEFLPSQRKICSYYYEMIIRVRDHFFDINEAEFLPEDCHENFRNQFNSWKTVSPGPFIVGQGAVNDESDTPFQKIVKILQCKIANYYSKITLKESRDSFFKNMEKVAHKDSIKYLPLFVENSFHFSDSVHTTKLRNHSLPKVMASKIAVFLRLYFEKNEVNGATKKDVILWLACEFYGIRGFKYDNLKGYFERESLSREHKEAGSTIVKSFRKKIN
jgi:hypothetical protein